MEEKNKTLMESSTEQHITNPSVEDDKERVPVEVSKWELYPGDVLAEQLGYYDNLKEGFVLDEKTIKQIKDMDFVKTVKILRKKSLIRKLEEERRKKEEEEQIEVVQVDEKEEIDSIFNKEADEKIKKLVEKKKQEILGEGVEDEVKEEREKILSRIDKNIKFIDKTEREKVHKAVHHLAESKVHVSRIESREGAEAEELHTALSNKEKKASLFMDALTTSKEVYHSMLNHVVVDYIGMIGDKGALPVLLSVIKSMQPSNYLATHSLVVMITSLMIAMELTKVVSEKINIEDKALSTQELRKIMSAKMKTYNMENLVDLGVTALLHDVAFKKTIPSLSPNYQITLKDKSKIDLHPSESNYMVSKLTVDFDVLQSIYQHHERIDGSGYPQGITAKRFAKYSYILTFVEHFVELTTPNPFHKQMTPADAIAYILRYERKQFDGDVLFAFVRASGLFPVGSWVQLSSGDFGIVVKSNKTMFDKPIVRVYLDPARQTITPPKNVDLAQDNSVKIIRAVDPKTLGLDVTTLEKFYRDAAQSI